MIDTTIPNSAGWWFSKLSVALDARRWRLDRLEAYYRGQCDLPESAEGAEDAYCRFQAKARVNFGELVVEATRERMSPVGFRTGSEGDGDSDAEAWAIWQANSMDSAAALVHRASLTMGDAYVIVGGPDPETGFPVITAEDPRQVITAHDPVRRSKVIAALKVFHDEFEGVDRAFLFLPGLVYQATKASRNTLGLGSAGILSHGWNWLIADDEGRPIPEELPFPIVPVVRFPNRQDLFGNTFGEFEGAMDTLDRLNHLHLQLLVIATIQAFRQRAISGLKVQDDQGRPITNPDGTPVDYDKLFRPGPAALWALPEGAVMWESGQVDLGGILQAIRHDVQDLAASTRTPLFYLTPDAANGSAEGAALASASLVFKVNDRITQASEPWELVIYLGLLFRGRRDIARQDMEILWAPPERFSLAERYDAASKAQAAGVPWRSVMADVLQFSPQQIDRMELERGADATIGQQPDQLEQGEADEVSKKATAFGALFRSGVTSESAAAVAGLQGLDYTGLLPVTLRDPDATSSQPAQLMGASEDA